MAAELKRKGSQTTILALHPGEVRTDMAKTVEADLGWDIEAPILSVQESVSACIGVVEGKGVGDSGTFWTWEDQVCSPLMLCRLLLIPLTLRYKATPLVIPPISSSTIMAATAAETPASKA